MQKTYAKGGSRNDGCVLDPVLVLYTPKCDTISGLIPEHESGWAFHGRIRGVTESGTPA